MSEQHFERRSRYSSTELNPWTSVWLHPRLTVRQQLDNNPTQYVMLLAMLGGISNSLSDVSSKNLGDVAGLITLIGGSIIAGIIAGIVGLYLSSWLIHWTGTWIGGRASSKKLRTALAWANVPSVWVLGLSVLLIVIFGKEMFATETPSLDASPMLWTVLIVVGLAQLVLGIWSLVILIAGVAEAQHFTVLRTFGNFALAFLMILVFMLPFLVIGFLFAYANGGLLG